MAIEVSKAGITETSQKLLSYAAELSDIFDNLQQITESIGTNITGFSEIEQLVDMLKQINQKKDKIVSEVKEFGNYLTSNVITGYSEFENMLASILSSIEINSSFLTKLASLSLIKLENTTFDSGGVVGGTQTSTGGTQTSTGDTQTSDGEIVGTSKDLLNGAGNGGSITIKNIIPSEGESVPGIPGRAMPPGRGFKPDDVPSDTWVDYDDGHYKGKVILPSDPVDPGMSV